MARDELNEINKRKAAAKQNFNHALYQAWLHRASIRELAEVGGISHETVRKITRELDEVSEEQAVYDG